MTGIVILAAGSSSRFGKPKQNLVFEGQTLLQRAINTASSSACRPVIVVLGANVETVRPTIKDEPVQIVFNEDWSEGMAASIRLGVTELKKVEPSARSVILMLCDQPLVNNTILQQLVQSKFEKGIVACSYSNTIGPPVLFDEFYFSDLLTLKGREGAKTLLLKYSDAVTIIPFALGSIDIDTVEDFNKIL